MIILKIKLIAIDLNKTKKELDANPKAIQQIEFVGQLKKLYNNNNNIMLIMLNLCLF